MPFIYQIVNKINKKVYIGKTLYDINLRWKQHISDSSKERNRDRPLYRAMNKYGIENFYIEKIEDVDTDQEACEREKFWIKELNTYIGFRNCNGYNATLGGDGKMYYDKNAIIQEYLKTYSISKTANKFGCSTDIVKDYCSQVGIDTATFNEIFQIDIKTMKTKKYSSIAEFINNNSEYKECDIRKALNNMYVYNGFIWLKKKDYSKDNIKKIIDRYTFEHGNTLEKKKGNHKYDYDAIYDDFLKTGDISSVLKKYNVPNDYCKAKTILKRDYGILIEDPKILCQYSKNGELLHVYKTIKDANISLEKPPYSRNIYSCIIGKTKTAYGYIWKYEYKAIIE